MPDEDATREAVVTALREHMLASADGAYLTDWILVAAGAMPDDADSTIYVSECSDGPMHHRLGLIRYLTLRNDRMAVDDDDD